MIDLDKYKVIPYKDHGRDFTGVDCWGLLYLFYKTEFGLLIPSWSAAYTTALKVPLKSVINNEDMKLGWKQLDKPKEHAAILMERAGFFHVGICLDKRGRNMMHIMKNTKVTIENPKSIDWKDQFRGWWEYAY